MRPHRGTMILVFGILGLVCCVAFGIAAWVMGSADEKAIAAGQMDPAGLGSTKAGRICGMISVILNIIGIIGYAIFFLMLAAGGALSQ